LFRHIDIDAFTIVGLVVLTRRHTVVCVTFTFDRFTISGGWSGII